MNSKRLLEEIEYNRDWRISELENIKKIYVMRIVNSKKYICDQYFRMCIPYIYAHWEGFITENYKLIIDYINSLNLAKQSVKIGLLTFSQLSKYRKLSGKQAFEDCCDFSKNIILEIGLILNIDQKNFNTKSNLNYEQLKEISKWFEMDFRSIEKHKISINKLVNLRNRIAHGENGIIIERSLLEGYISELAEIFDKILIIIEDYILAEKYLNI